jgi:nucleotide-binding universal stress UspA family protein
MQDPPIDDRLGSVGGGGRMKLTSILVPLDGTAAALSALPVAQTLAELGGATLHIVHVHERPLPVHDLLSRIGIAADECSGCVVEQATGPPAERIMEFASERDIDLLVLCTHTAAGRKRGALGGTTRAVLGRSPCPVVLTPPERGKRPWALRRIVLAQNGTPTSASAIDAAATIARRAHVELLVLHMATPRAEQPTEPGTITAPLYVDQPQYEWPLWGREFLDRLVALGHPPPAVHLRLILEAGEYGGAEVVRVAREHDSDLIVLAWHGTLEGKHAAIVKAALQDAHCPVLVVRAQPDPSCADAAR